MNRGDDGVGFYMERVRELEAKMLLRKRPTGEES